MAARWQPKFQDGGSQFKMVAILWSFGLLNMQYGYIFDMEYGEELWNLNMTARTPNITAKKSIRRMFKETYVLRLCYDILVSLV